MKFKERFIVYHSHYTKVIGRTDKIEVALHIGEQYGCRDFDCLCCHYYVYDRKLKTNDITKIVKGLIKEEDYEIYRKTGKWRR